MIACISGFIVFVYGLGKDLIRRAGGIKIATMNRPRRLGRQHGEN